MTRQVQIITQTQREKSEKIFEECAHEICPHFQIMPQNAEAFKELKYYTLGFPHKEIEPQKGLWLWGDIGVGKTTLLYIMQRYLLLTEACEHSRFFKIISPAKLSLDVIASGPAILSDYYTDNIAFDDLGKEICPVGIYGSTINVMQMLLQIRYNYCGRFRTFVTTNLAPQDIIKMYGASVRDRCVEMFNFLEFRGMSYRK